ncbi:hypothetical protein CHS0354_042393 [Potamilus streckersoni]|uniref:Uncharacterized protein n=1 Tax=Potamilus streckersoni TaxID=2493646 RepID=A0AAE0STW0_9BIVA|nr:hypothetical protein CHS0354_042393 [Potamilus streckersoni]
MCDTGTRTRNRECNNPAPSSGGNDCAGLQFEESSCADLCPVDGNWGTWGTWSTCICNIGTHNRTRECNNPLPARGGDDCVGAHYEHESCVDQCPDSIFTKECLGTVNREAAIKHLTNVISTVCGTSISLFENIRFDKQSSWLRSFAMVRRLTGNPGASVPCLIMVAIKSNSVNVPNSITSYSETVMATTVRCKAAGQ